MFSAVTKQRKALIAVGIALLVPFAIFERAEHSYIWHYGYTQIYIGYGLILLGAVAITREESKENLAQKFFAWVGQNSYAIFLWQGIAGMFVCWLMSMISLQAISPELNCVVFNGLFLSCSIVLGTVLGTLVEKPIMKIREKWAPSKYQVN